MNTLNVKLSHSISQLYETLCQVGKSTFAELQRATNFKDTELCLALCSLMHDNKVYQARISNTVYYIIKLCSPPEIRSHQTRSSH